jgi:hypothetical protein
LLRINLFLFVQILIMIFFISCKDENSAIVTPSGRSSIQGTVKFLDNSIAPYAKIELKSNLADRSIYDTCDANGNFSFKELHGGDYTLIFRSTNYDLNTTYVNLSLTDNDNVTQNVFITYNMLDDFAEKIINDGVYFIKFQSDGARLGGNFNLVDHLSGYYRNNSTDTVTLSAKVYRIPLNLDWNTINFSSDSVPSNFEFLFDVNDEKTNFGHQVQISGDDIPIIFSNPPNGFAFVVKQDSVKAKLKIPCVDFNNNDFGLKITYK